MVLPSKESLLLESSLKLFKSSILENLYVVCLDVLFVEEFGEAFPPRAKHADELGNKRNIVVTINTILLFKE